MVLVFSATKGLAAMAMALAHSRGWLDFDERVCAYWPEFAQAGKDKITVRQLLAHQAGLIAFPGMADRNLIGDLDQLAVVLARQEPAWTPGQRQGYHALSLGYYESELLRRIDPKHRSLGQFFQDEIAAPSAFMPATSKCRPAEGLVRHAPSHTLMASSPGTAMSSRYAQKRWRRSKPRQYLRSVASVTHA